ncbi:ABC transporter [Lachnospiraceae bacterium XBB1006]|nr:ABC transporter [Lachnospiraceae bacterium XBB1006]
MEHKHIIQNVFLRQRGIAACVFVMQVVMGFFPAVYVIVYAAFIDNMVSMVNGKNYDASTGLVIVGTVGFSAFQYLCNAYLGYKKQKLRLSIEVVEKELLMKKVLRLPFLEMEDAETYDLINHVKRGIPEHYYNYYTSFLGVINLAVSVISVMVIIMRHSLGIGIIATLAFCPIFVLSIKGGQEDYSELSRFMDIARRTESYETMISSETKSFERALFPFGEWILGKWSQSFDRGAEVYLGYKRKSYTRIKTMSFLIKLLLCVIIGFILFLTTQKKVSIGVCTILMQQVISLSQRVTWDLYMYLYNITAATEYQKRYDQMYALREEEMQGDILADAHKIVFEDVSFRYKENMPYVLRHLNLTLEKGKSYAIVGENGAGKSTLMKILLGFYGEYEGNIWVHRFADSRN